jgi:V8-like Glu-specific endopeptidase
MSSIRRAVARIRKGGWRLASLAAVPIIVLGVGLPRAFEQGGPSSERPRQGAGSAALPPSTMTRHDALPGKKTPAEVRAFWTPRRMREARPVPLLRSPHAGGGTPAEGTGRLEPEGPPPSFVPPDAPGGGVPKLRHGLVKGGTRQLQLQPQAAIPYERYEIPDTVSFPARVQGKVFFTGGGYLWVCSATVVTTPVQSVVFTAGHCVYHPSYGGWASNWMFVPGYHEGSEPFGSYTAADLFSLNGWFYYGLPSYDIGAALLTRPIEAEVGARGIAFNQPREQQFTSWGYPAAEPFDGEDLYVCVSEYGMSDPYPPPLGPAPLGIGCDMTGGSSGGGWVIGNQSLNSLNSFKYEQWSEVMFGPYFGEGALNLYNGICCIQHTLVVQRGPLLGTGRITSSPPGINCGETCQADFYHGRSVTLSATPASGSSFAFWTGCDSSSGNECTINMNESRTVRTDFNLESRHLSVNLEGSGRGTVTSSAPPVNCPPTCSADPNYGDSVNLSATPASGSIFAGWTGDCSGTDPCALVMNMDKRVTATFNLPGGGRGGAQGASPPATAITRVTINGDMDRAKFRFTGSGGSGALSFLCKIDRNAFRRCVSPRIYRHLRPGDHTFRVKAIDSTGQVDSTPATRKFRIPR